MLCGKQRGLAGGSDQGWGGCGRGPAMAHSKGRYKRQHSSRSPPAETAAAEDIGPLEEGGADPEEPAAAVAEAEFNKPHAAEAEKFVVAAAVANAVDERSADDADASLTDSSLQLEPGTAGSNRIPQQLRQGHLVPDAWPQIASCRHSLTLGPRPRPHISRKRGAKKWPRPAQRGQPLPRRLRPDGRARPPMMKCGRPWKMPWPFRQALQIPCCRGGHL